MRVWWCVECAFILRLRCGRAVTVLPLLLSLLQSCVRYFELHYMGTIDLVCSTVSLMLCLVLRKRKDCAVMATLHTDCMEIVNSYCSIG